MRPRRTPARAVDLHIERLVVDGPALTARERDQLAWGISDELEGALSRLLSAAALDARPGRLDQLTLDVDQQPGRDGRTVGGAVGRALAEGIGPRLAAARPPEGGR